MCLKAAEKNRGRWLWLVGNLLFFLRPPRAFLHFPTAPPKCGYLSGNKWQTKRGTRWSVPHMQIAAKKKEKRRESICKRCNQCASVLWASRGHIGLQNIPWTWPFPLTWSLQLQLAQNEISIKGKPQTAREWVEGRSKINRALRRKLKRDYAAHNGQQNGAFGIQSKGSGN